MKNTLFISISTLLMLSGCAGLTAVHIPGHWHQEGISILCKKAA